MKQKKAFHRITVAVVSTLTTTSKANIISFTPVNANQNYIGDIVTLCKQGQLKEALYILHDMWLQRIPPNSSIYASLVQCCADTKDLLDGKQVHALILQTGFISEVYLENKLVIMYAKCGSLLESRNMFDEMPNRNVVSWTVMISAYVKKGFGEEALSLYSQMKSTGCQPDRFTFASVVSACGYVADLQQGKELHEEIQRSGVGFNVFVGSALIDMYVKCGSLEDARNVFDKMPERNVVSWTSMIAGYAQNGYVDQALVFFEKMPMRDLVSWNVMIAGYAQHGYVEKALELFRKMPERDAVSWNAMLAGYAQNGLVDEARDFFNKMPQRNVVSWNIMITAYSKQNRGYEVLNFFKQMKLRRIQPDRFTFFAVLSACASLETMEYGKEVHEDIINRGIQSNVLLRSSLVDMYAKCGCLEDALKVFEIKPVQDVGLWNVLIAGYARNGQVDEALKLFEKMNGRNVDSWNSTIAGCLQNGWFDRAVEIYQQMQLTGMKPDSVTIVTVLPAFANLAALQHGRKLHTIVLSSGLMCDVFVASSLVDMYAKCGNIQDARNVFDEMSAEDMVLWTAIIVGYAINGYGKEALKLFEQMLHFKMKPNGATIVGVLLACCHAGLVDEGWKYFNCMSRDYHITPGLKHYCCMVDLLCRCGHLDEAHDFINQMPIKPDAAVWGSLLGGCRIYGDINLGEQVANYLFEADSKNPAHYVLLSNIYAASGRWNEVENIRKMMKDTGVKKMPGCSWIEINNKVHAFVVGD